MFKLRVDTGGTFTDCRGLEEGETTPRLVKVLSSGRLRVSVSDWISPQELTIAVPENWRVEDSFFTGYKLESGGESALVLSFEVKSGRLVLSQPLPPSESVDLFTREEAPILGARLLTGTALDKPFPELDFRLATTRGTNALLERKGAPVAFFVTKGFRDLLTIRDQRRPDLFALKHERPAPLFSCVSEVTGRLAANGDELTALQWNSELEQEVKSLIEAGIRIAAVALLHSYANPSHEEALRKKLLAAGFDHVSISSELAPVIKLLPRAETAVANAYLQPVMAGFINHVAERSGAANLLTMTSAGGLETASSFHPKDSLLSGPAGGVSGAAAIAEELGIDKILTFDMGGTSTDVARYDNGFQYQFEQTVGDAKLLSPALKIETVAAGGGSICQWENGALKVGPESAGANPGPACYGMGGPLTITDVNLILGRIDPSNFGIPLTESNFEAAKNRALELQREAGMETHEPDEDFLRGLLDIAIEQMADAIRSISIRDGANPSEYTLLAFGGAGPLHACAIADRLGMKGVVIPGEAGVLSAYGLDQASIERFATRQINLPVSDPTLSDLFETVDSKALEQLGESGFKGTIQRRIAELRLAGQDATLSVEVTTAAALPDSFAALYKETFGYTPTGNIEIVSYRAIAGTGRAELRKRALSVPNSTGSGERSNPVGNHSGRGEASLPGRAVRNDVESSQPLSSEAADAGPPTQREASPCPMEDPAHADSEVVPFLNRDRINEGTAVSGPIVIQDPFSTLYLAEGWDAEAQFNGALLLERKAPRVEADTSRPEQIVRELFRHRFDNLVEEMGTMLQRSAISTNVKERADFSCALLDGEGELISSAPHIPVHLGALGVCVRQVRDQIVMKEGDTIITNHPGVGGSHLPDVTLITPVFEPGNDSPVAYIANRAHHAEIGGITPGSMPPGAENLAAEGVVISPKHLIRGGDSCFDTIEALLTESPYPTRNIADNLSDLNAQLAANRRGVATLTGLLESHGSVTIAEQFHHLKRRSHEVLRHHLKKLDFTERDAEEFLDDGTRIRAAISRSDRGLRISFEGTSPAHQGNLNATPAIIQSAVLYVLRLWTQSEVPLNEGLLAAVEIDLPPCFLNPHFTDDPLLCPAVVGGNVETSQRVVDTLIKALEIQSCSQGTMNNFLFGNESFGYYETICGGSGAGNGYDGTDGIHTHMTNTAITDPEILEYRYPVRLKQFSLREGSGGEGRWKGGEGIVREIEFLDSLEVSLLTQHRKVAPFGLGQGGSGAVGEQWLNGEPLAGIASFPVGNGDILTIRTPGGGGFGSD